jgi:hypothetical protein
MTQESDERLLQEELDRRFGDLKNLVDERRDNTLRDLASLKELMLAGQAAGHEAVQAALASAEKAVIVAQAAQEKRLDGVNEFRAQQGDLIRNFVTRDEVTVRVEALQAAIDRNTANQAALELRLSTRLERGEGAGIGASGQRDETRLNVGTMITLGMFAIAVLTFIILYVTKK